MATTIEKAEQTEKTPAVQPSGWSDLFDRWFTDWPGADVLRVEQLTEGDQVIVRAEMPGIDPDKDVQITVSDHTLHLRAERRQESKTEEKGGYRSEFRYGSFARTLPLPVGATEKDVKATYKDGILEVRIPIDRKQANAKKVPIQRVNATPTPRPRLQAQPGARLRSPVGPDDRRDREQVQERPQRGR